MYHHKECNCQSTGPGEDITGDICEAFNDGKHLVLQSLDRRKELLEVASRLMTRHGYYNAQRESAVESVKCAAALISAVDEEIEKP